ncbi:exported hypothetical protein [Gammaproteobacteria bacterium]
MKKSQLIATAAVISLGSAVVMSVGAFDLRHDSENMYGRMEGGKIVHDMTDLNAKLLGESDERSAMEKVVCPHANDVMLACKLGCIRM